MKLFAGFPAEVLKYNEPMGGYTSFRVGGPADLLVLPQSREQALKAIGLLRSNGIKHFVMGNGTNILIPDEGYRGVIVRIGSGIDEISVDGVRLTAGAGASLARVSNAAMEAGLAGLEFASGIPGSLGGAVCMNAGAYGGEIKDVLDFAEVLGEEPMVLTNGELEFSYRGSRVQREAMVVLKAAFNLTRGDVSEIQAKTRELNSKRRDKQPLEFPSAGSTFKRPPGQFAGKLIMDAGLAGFSIGGARVSEKHCGFIINAGGAKAEDILKLMDYVICTVREKFGVELEPEVKVLR